MLTRNAARRIRTSLPIEIVSLILDEVATDPSTSNTTLYRCSQVCSSWEALSLTRLYAHLLLVNAGAETVRLLAGSAAEALRRYQTKTLEVDTVDDGAWQNVRRILGACQGLHELVLRNEDLEHEFPQQLLEHPSLVDLRSLTLCHSVKGSDSEIEGCSTAFHLHKLVTDGRPSQSDLLDSIVRNNALTNSLRHLELLSLERNNFGTFIEEGMHLLQPLAPGKIFLSRHSSSSKVIPRLRQ